MADCGAWDAEPPRELLYDPTEDPQHFNSFSALLPQLPSLASSIKSSPRSESAMLDDDGGDAAMLDDQDSQSQSQLPPSSPPPLPSYGEGYENGDLEDEIEVDELGAEVAEQRRAQFGQALLQADCPACKTAAPTIRGSEQEGARCVSCGWGIEMIALEELGRLFGLHGSVRFPLVSSRLSASGELIHSVSLRRDLSVHQPIFMWTQFTGNIVLCSACEVEYAA